MPLLPPAMQGLMQAKAASKAMAGQKLPSMISALSMAICQYVLLSSVVNSTNVAMGPGAGTQMGRVVGLNANLMATAMMMKAASMGISGRDTRKFFDAVAFGVVQAMNTVVMQGTIIGAGPGSGTGKIIGLVPTALLAFMLSQAAFRMLAGSKMKSVLSAVAFGVCTHIMSVGVVTITDIGVAASPPAGPVPVPAAPGIGRLV